MNTVFIIWIQYSFGFRSCMDDPNYTGPFDEVCEQWQGIDCTSAHWRLGPVEQRVLLTKCPKSCRQCGKGKIILKPLNLHPLQCHDDLRWKKKCISWKGRFCALELGYKKKKDLVRHCRETCRVFKKDFSQQEPPPNCLFPFKFEDKWYKTCMDTVGLSPYTLSKVTSRKEEHGWCPLYLEKDRSYEGNGVFRPCFSPDEKRKMYHRCRDGEDCHSNVCEVYSDGKKRCALNIATSCHTRNGPGNCPKGFKCNPNGRWKTEEYYLYDQEEFDRMFKEIEFLTWKLNGEAAFRKRNEIVKKYPLQKFVALRDLSWYTKHPCIQHELTVPRYHSAQRNSRICIGLYATIECELGTYCNPYGPSPSEMCLFDLSDIEESSVNELNEYSKNISILIGVLSFFLISILSFILMKRQRKKYKKIMKMEKEKNRMREYKIWERAGKILENDGKQKGTRWVRKSTKCRRVHHTVCEKSVLRNIPEFKFIQESSISGTLKSYTCTYRSDITYETCDLEKFDSQQIEDTLSDDPDIISENSDTNHSSRRFSV